MRGAVGQPTTSVVARGRSRSIAESMGRKKQRSGGGHPGPLSEGRVRIVGPRPYLYCCLLNNRNPLSWKSTKSKNFPHHTDCKPDCQNGSDSNRTACLARPASCGEWPPHCK